MTVVPNHRKDVDAYLPLILDLSGRALARLRVQISVEKLRPFKASALTKEAEGRDHRCMQRQNPSCSTLINLISVASKGS